MNIKDKVILITGANRGIGRALVDEALRRGAKRVYAGTRVAFSHPDERVTPLALDVTDVSQIREAAAKIEALDILINNAGVAFYDDLSDRAMIERHMAVNFYGPYELSQALLPLLIRSRGAIVNNLSIVALAPLPMIASYSVSKAAAFSLTQSQRAFLAGQGVRVQAILTGPVDTDMNRGLDIPKTPPSVAAEGIFDGVEREEEEIFPDAMSMMMAEGWRGGAVKAFARQYGGAVGRND